jgi:transcriptional regulator with XRE-family HTH domain
MRETAAWVGQRVKERRQALGLSQSELAAAVGVKQGAISQWETGRRSPGLDELLALASNLDVEISELMPSPQRQRSDATVLLRAYLEATGEEALREGVEDFIREVEELAPLERRVKIPADRPLRAAQQLLMHAERFGIRGPKYDVNVIAELVGARVLARPLPDDISGLLVQQGGNVAIGVNQHQYPGRQRFTVAHELGHFVLNHHDRFHLDLGPSNSFGDSPNFDWRLEREANDFAANLLMPASLLRDHWKPSASPKELADVFGVSPIAMTYRLESLDIPPQSALPNFEVAG